MHDLDNAKFQQRPLVVYDGLCFFCSRCVAFLKARIASPMFYIPYQELGDTFDAKSMTSFKRALHLFTEDGKMYFGADAVFRIFSILGGIYSLPLFLYGNLFFFDKFSEFIYVSIAKNRSFFSYLTRLFTCFSSYASHVLALFFLRALACVYFLAFLSLFLEHKGLYASGGILPFVDLFDVYEFKFGHYNFFKLPSLFWFSQHDLFLLLFCILSLFASVLLFINIFPAFMALFLWVSYLSFVTAGSVFMQFQWDYLLLEVGFLALFLCPFRYSIFSRYVYRCSYIWVFLFRLLLFRLLFFSGLVKLLSLDPSWSSLSALNFHFLSQPIPHYLSYFFHLLPDYLLKAGVLFAFFVELVVPFFIFLTYKFRKYAFYLINLFMLFIMLSGNFCFFNILLMSLTIFLLDPESLLNRFSILRLNFFKFKVLVIEKALSLRVFQFLLAIILFISVIHFEVNRFMPRYVPRPLAAPVLDIFPIVNAYGLFAVITQRRYVLEFEATMDGLYWESYTFRYNAPKWSFLMQPRLDWQLWFASLTSYEGSPWMPYFLHALLLAKPDVINLLDEAPFVYKAPLAIRINRYEYKFSELSDFMKGEYWRKEYLDTYLPAISLTK
eukprot:COSAG01_NODE_6791_length_3496_cov_1.503091_3_plen_610_part_00